MKDKKSFVAEYVFKDGNMSNDKEIIDIIKRITGKVFDVNSEIRLSSAQQYAFITLCKKNGKKINKKLIDNNFKIKNILSNEVNFETKKTKHIINKYNDSKNQNINKNNFAVGIDIQNIGEFIKLIEGNNLKNSDFIKDYFTDKEIAYSESRPDMMETICGIYSAKESIRKTGNKNDFKKIEIIHINGRPTCKNYHISISHSAGVCVAVCIQT